MQAEIAWALPRAHIVTVGESGSAQQPLPSATSRDTGHKALMPGVTISVVKQAWRA